VTFDLLKSDSFWREEVRCETPAIEGLGSHKLVRITSDIRKRIPQRSGGLMHPEPGSNDATPPVLRVRAESRCSQFESVHPRIQPKSHIHLSEHRHRLNVARPSTLVVPGELVQAGIAEMAVGLEWPQPKLLGQAERLIVVATRCSKIRNNGPQFEISEQSSGKRLATSLMSFDRGAQGALGNLQGVDVLADEHGCLGEPR